MLASLTKLFKPFEYSSIYIFKTESFGHIVNYLPNKENYRWLKIDNFIVALSNHSNTVYREFCDYGLEKGGWEKYRFPKHVFNDVKNKLNKPSIYLILNEITFTGFTGM